jgi:hypothetical protein
MAQNLVTIFDTVDTVTITLAGLTTTSSRIGSSKTNTNSRPALLFGLKLGTFGTAPTAGAVIELYLLRRTTNVLDDNATMTDAVYPNPPTSPTNTYQLGVLVCVNSTSYVHAKTFNSAPLGPLNSTWTIAVRNLSGQTFNATEGNFTKEFQYYYTQSQP